MIPLGVYHLIPPYLSFVSSVFFSTLIRHGPRVEKPCPFVTPVLSVLVGAGVVKPHCSLAEPGS